MPDLYISKLLTGHIYFNSPYEGCDSCGTCDGGRCDGCHERYAVTEFDDLGLIPGNYKVFQTKDDAEKFVEELERRCDGRSSMC